MTERITCYPGYNVLDKWSTPSWDDPTRQVVSERMSVTRSPRFFDAQLWRTAQALCHCIVPQAQANPEIPLAAMVDDRLHSGIKDGFRDVRLPDAAQAWRVGLHAIDAESNARWGNCFADASAERQQLLLKDIQTGSVHDAAWQGMPPALFFSERVLHDICATYYSHPHSWSEIGFGGPANPRGYVRMYFDRRDPWEGKEAMPDGSNKT